MSDTKKCIEINGIKFYHQNYVMVLQSSLTTVTQALTTYIEDNEDDLTGLRLQIQNLKTDLNSISNGDDMKF